jgi:hypothetical protein
MAGIIYSQDCKSKLIINSEISNLRVFINDSLEYSNKYEFELDKGFYKISILEDSDRWNSRALNDSLFIDSCETKIINFYAVDDILIDSNPQDVQVFSGDSLLGYTPLIIPLKFDKLILKKEGFTEEVISLNENMTKVTASLEFVGELKKENFFDKAISKVLFGSMIALGATSAYFKIKADDSYDNYLKTGDIKYKDRTDEYDLVSGVTLGLTQINFGYLIYKIFFDN